MGNDFYYEVEHEHDVGVIFEEKRNEHYRDFADFGEYRL